jgi:hypothetical protein
MFLVLGMLFAAGVHAATVTVATGGNAIASNTAPACSAGGTWTSLTGPTISEANAGEVGLGNIVLTVPAGFEFNTGNAVTVYLTGNGTSSRNINNLARNASYPVTSMTATTITFSITAISTRTNTLTWQGIQVRPTAATPLATGNITHKGTSAITGITATTNLGSLTEVTSAPACLPTAPTVTTNAASALNVSGATLNGSVSSNGASTAVTFEYGLTTGYGDTLTAATSPLATNAVNAPVSAVLTGLTCATTYHFRAVGANTIGTTNGLDRTFTTSACLPPSVTTDAATALTTTGATLNATVNDNGADTTVIFEYGTTVGYGSSIAAVQSPLPAGYGASPVFASVSGLTCGSTYHYRAKVTNSVATVNGVDKSFATTACPVGLSVTASPGLCVNATGVGANAWSTQDADLSDNLYATTSLNDNQQSNYLKCTGYGFAIPAGSTIRGITVNVERSASGSQIQDLRMRTVKNNAIGATDRSTTTAWPTTDTVEAHGGAADLWGTTWTSADINNANFGAALAAQKAGTSGGTRTVNVDHMPITVDYTPASPWVASINRNSANPTASNTSVSWDVLFSGNATGVDSADFQLVLGGAATGATITSVAGSGRVWTVTANTGSGATGTLGLNLVDNDTIQIGGVALGGVGLNNGNFTGQVYIIEVPVCDGTAIFCDDFERSNPAAVGNGWTITPGPAADCAGVAGNTGCAGIDSDIPPYNGTTTLRPNPTRALFTRWSIVSVDSRTINLSGYPSALLSFWMRRGGDAFSEYPEAVGEDYLVQYFASDGTWKVLAQYPTGVMQGQVFTPVIQLPPDAMHANFKLRFYQPAGSGDANGGATGGAPGVVGYDYWHFDNVIIRDAPESSYTGAFCDNFEAGLGRWSISAEGAPPTAAIGDADLKTTDFNSATHELDLRWGYVVASTLRTDLTGVGGNIEYWLKSGTTAARDPDAGEDLVVEYRNSAGVWTPLATYLGSDPAGTVYSGSHPIPVDAQHSGFRLRFRMLNGNSFDNDYWHLDDVCVGASLSDVDLSLTKSHTGPITPGANATYTLTVSNASVNALAGTISVVDTLPAGLSYYSASGTGWTCSANGQEVTCSYVGTLNGGASAPPITLIAAVDAGVSGTLTNTAVVSGSSPDANTVNNTATDTVILTPGFVFTDGPCVNGLAFGAAGQTCSLITWTPQVAGQDSVDIYITRVNTAQRPSQYTADTTVNLEFGLSCHNPAANAGVNATFSAAGSALPVCEASGATPTTWSTGKNATFTANTTSVGPYTFNYADVGRVELHVRNSAATTQAGSSGAFVVKPAGFVLSNIVRTSDSFANPGAANAGGTRFVRAGEAFSVTVTAVNAGGTATPNYGKETTKESVKLTSNLVAGLGLANNPALAGTFGNFGLNCAGAAGTNGAACGTVFNWGEVGIITLTPSVKDGDYLGAGEVTGTTSGNVGRFYPDHFDTEITQVDGIPMDCPGTLTCTPTYEGIVYSGQEYTLAVTAMNASGTATANYVDSSDATKDFAKTVTLSVVGALGTDTATSGAGALGLTSISAFTGGAYSTAAQKYTFSALQTPPADIFVRAVDADGVSSKRLSNPTTASVEGGVTVVSGRLKVANAYGSNLLPLSLEATVQYYTATGWVTSLTDSVTKLALPGTLTVGAGLSTVSSTPSDRIVNAGKLTINLATPTAGGSGSVTVTPGIDAASPGNPPLAVVAGQANFGVYRGNNEFIYQREAY